MKNKKGFDIYIYLWPLKYYSNYNILSSKRGNQLSLAFFRHLCFSKCASKSL